MPAGVPSTLLERRPDVAEAERKMAAANAQIGVAKAGYFPGPDADGQDEYSSNKFSRIDSEIQPHLGGRPRARGNAVRRRPGRAQVRGARAAYEGTVDTYRQTVLSGLQQVEDQIVTLRVLEQEGVIEDETVKKAREAEKLTLNQYKAGTVPYSSVITAQTTRLSAEETALQVLSSRLQASVALIEALGGGWDASQATAK